MTAVLLEGAAPGTGAAPALVITTGRGRATSAELVSASGGAVVCRAPADPVLAGELRAAGAFGLCADPAGAEFYPGPHTGVPLLARAGGAMEIALAELDDSGGRLRLRGRVLSATWRSARLALSFHTEQELT